LDHENRNPSSVSLGNLLVLVNAVIRNPRDATSESRDHLMHLVNSRISNRHKLDNMFSLLQYLRFTTSCNISFSSSLVGRTLDSVCMHSDRPVKTTELLEVTDRVISASLPSLDLLQIIRSSFSELTSVDPDAFSDRTNIRALGVAERLSNVLQHSINLPISVEFFEALNLLMDITRNRHCGSPEILRLMLTVASELKSSDQPHRCGHVMEYIRDHQLSRWRSVKNLFQETPGLRHDMWLLFQYAGVDMKRRDMSGSCAPKSYLVWLPENRTISGQYRLWSDEKPPIYKNSDKFLYFTSGAWQIGPDPADVSTRVAFVPVESASTPPPRSSGWWVYSKAHGRMVEVGVDRPKQVVVGVKRVVGENEEEGVDGETEDGVEEVVVLEQGTRPLTRWNRVHDIPSDSIDSKLHMLEQKIAQLEAIVHQKGEPVEKETAMPSPPIPSTPPPPDQPPLFSFDAFRESELRREAQERMHKLAARRFR
jgi:hypothetical protein